MLQIIILANILFTGTVFSQEHSFCQTAHYYHHDAESVRRFDVNELVGGNKNTDTIALCDRTIKWRSFSRIYKLIQPVVYDALAEDVATGMSVVVRSLPSLKEAVDASLPALFNLLKKTHVIDDPCSVPNYPETMVNPNGVCPPGSTVDTCTICDFQCAQQGDDVIGDPFIMCCGNTEFNTTVPSCKGLSTPSLRPISRPGQKSPSYPTTLSTPSPSSPSSISSTTTNTMTDLPTTKNPVATAKIGVNRLVYLSIPTGIVFFSIIVFFGIKIFPRPKKGHDIIESGREYSKEVLVVHPDNNGLYRDHIIKEATPTEKQLLRTENYDMDAFEKGIVFIINNLINSEDEKLRGGSQIDVTNIEHVFREIGYEPVIETQLTSNEIKSSIDQMKSRIMMKHTSVVVVVIAHGDEHNVQGVDDQAVPLVEIQDQFSTKNCPILEDKPKIFFFQCLREKNKPRGATGMTSYRHQQMKRGLNGVGSSSSPDVITGFSSTKSSSIEADGFLIENMDSFIVHATMKEYESIRDGVNGSWFIQILSEELLARSHRDNLDSIMTGVTRRVARIGHIPSPRIMKLGISKKIYFLPKYQSQRQMMDVDLHFRESYIHDVDDDDDTPLLPL